MSDEFLFKSDKGKGEWKRTDSGGNRLDGPMMYMCNRKNHPAFLREQVYMKRCEDINVHVNSGVEELLLNSATCFCTLESVSFRDLMLGDRGMQAILPLFKSCRRLKSMSLAGNNMREKSLTLVCKTLREVNTLTLLSVLDLSHNPITAASGQEITNLLTHQRTLLLLGCMGTSLPGVRRQRLLRQTLASFAISDPSDMCKAWQLASPGGGFVDCELWVQCTPIVEEQCSREQLAECMETIASYKAGPSNRISIPSEKGRSMKQKDVKGPVPDQDDLSDPGMESIATTSIPGVRFNGGRSTSDPGVKALFGRSSPMGFHGSPPRPSSCTATPRAQTTLDLLKAMEYKNRDSPPLIRPLSAVNNRPSGTPYTIPRNYITTPPPQAPWGRDYRRAVKVLQPMCESKECEDNTCHVHVKTGTLRPPMRPHSAIA